MLALCPSTLTGIKAEDSRTLSLVIAQNRNPSNIWRYGQRISLHNIYDIAAFKWLSAPQLSMLSPSHLAEIKARESVIITQLEGLREREHDLTTLIGQMEAMRTDVQAKSASLEAQLKKLKALKCSISRLPSELLLHIFDICVATDAINTRQPTYLGAAMSVSQPPVEITYQCSKGGPRDNSVEDLILDIVDIYSPSLNSFTWKTLDSKNLPLILALVNRPTAFLAIRCLHLSCEAAHIANYARQEESAGRKVRLPSSSDEEWSCSLEELHLDHIPLSFLSSFLFTNLRSMELNSTGLARPPIHLSVLCSFITTARRLEVLVLTQIHILFPGEDVLPTSLEPVESPSLKHIEWNGQLSYTDLHKLFRLLHFPSLEIIDICVDKISDHGVRLGAAGVMIFKCLKELYIQFECDFDNNKHESSLRCYAFPHLEKLDLINTGLCPIHGTVPRLEQIFRDPRLPHLTHLTLSRYEITTAQRTEVQAILGYLPALTYLGLDTCVGVGVVLDCLTDLTVITTFAGDGSGKGFVSTGSPRVKFCPRLKILTFWRCNDLEIKDLRAVITARNKQYEAMPGQEQDNDISSRALSRKEKNAQLLRVIKPLRKPRSQQHGEPRQEKAKIDLEPSSMTHMDHGVPVPIIGVPTPTADLIHVRIEGCEAVEEEEALSLEKLGGLEVAWK
ncbi:hypothetical protein BDN71DRAFT_1429829 [Pleurotus eryngii]|uniref:Uncharacterized protein n=1 Tax=Pleurotus eryngii TaxID=5323 RepID=A0A9P6DHX0_PLEER|nr:hypothetical protein BDN71DRAFT_1429829 [Pleurotus eryngii]